METNWFRDCKTIAQAKKRRSELAKRYHPDVNKITGDKQKMADINNQFDRFKPSGPEHSNTFKGFGMGGNSYTHNYSYDDIFGGGFNSEYQKAYDKYYKGFSYEQPKSETEIINELRVKLEQEKKRYDSLAKNLSDQAQINDHYIREAQGLRSEIRDKNKAYNELADKLETYKKEISRLTKLSRSTLKNTLRRWWNNEE